MFRKFSLKWKIFWLTLDLWWDEMRRKLGIVNRTDHFYEDSVHVRKERRNEKLRRGVEKLVEIIYDENGKLKPWVKDYKEDLIDLIPPMKQSKEDKQARLRILHRMMENPTPDNYTIKDLVDHHTRNAERYDAIRQHRELCKKQMYAIKKNDVKQVKILAMEINGLKRKIKKMEVVK
jgi:hypothetical protein